MELLIKALPDDGRGAAALQHLDRVTQPTKPSRGLTRAQAAEAIDGAVGRFAKALGKALAERQVAMVKCPTCGGDGVMAAGRVCRDCGGDGQVTPLKAAEIRQRVTPGMVAKAVAGHVDQTAGLTPQQRAEVARQVAGAAGGVLAIDMLKKAL